jgi:heme oxygenase
MGKIYKDAKKTLKNKIEIKEEKVKSVKEEEKSRLKKTLEFVWENKSLLKGMIILGINKKEEIKKKVKGVGMQIIAAVFTAVTVGLGGTKMVAEFLEEGENFENRKTNYIGKIELERITKKGEELFPNIEEKEEEKNIYINVVTFLVAGISLGYLGYNFYKNIYLEVPEEKEEELKLNGRRKVGVINSAEGGETYEEVINSAEALEVNIDKELKEKSLEREEKAKENLEAIKKLREAGEGKAEEDPEEITKRREEIKRRELQAQVFRLQFLEEQRARLENNPELTQNLLNMRPNNLGTTWKSFGADLYKDPENVKEFTKLTDTQQITEIEAMKGNPEIQQRLMAERERYLSEKNEIARNRLSFQRGDELAERTFKSTLNKAERKIPSKTGIIKSVLNHFLGR